MRPWNGNAEPPPRKSGETFAADRAVSPRCPPPFDGKRAMGYLEAICARSARASAARDGMKKQQELIQKHFEDLGGKVTLPAASRPGSAASRKAVR